jgi:hypothetical protein
MCDEAAVRAAILALADRRRGSFCPSEVARALSPAWRGLMPRVRQVAAAMQAEGLIRATQRGVAVDPLAARGPIRLEGR